MAKNALLFSAAAFSLSIVSALAALKSTFGDANRQPEVTGEGTA